MKIEEQETKVINSHSGKSVRTIRTYNGVTYMITTSKYGKMIRTSGIEVNASGNGKVETISFTMFDNKDEFAMSHGRARATEKTLLKFHYEALAKFDEWVEDKPEPIAEPELYDILFLDGYDKTKNSDGNKKMIYKIEDSEWGKRYHCVELDTLKLSVEKRPRPFSEKFGIGTYYEKGYNAETFNLSSDDISNMLIDAQKVREEELAKKKKEQEEAAKKAEEHKKYLSQFKKADRRKTTSIVKSEIMKRWGDKVSKVTAKSDVFSGGSSFYVNYTSPERIPELESFVKRLQYGSFNGMIDMYEHDNDRKEVIIDGYILNDYKYADANHVEGDAPEKPTKIDTETPTDLGVEIVEYSEKAIAVIGDTKPLKDDLKSIGGRFNPRLKCGMGWIFPKTKIEEVKALLSR